MGYNKYMKLGQKGMSLVGVVMAAGLLGLVSLGVMRLSSNMQFIQTQATGSMDETTLNLQASTLLGPGKHCRLNFAGKDSAGNIVADVKSFQKSQIDEPENPSEGLELELYLASPDGNALGRKVLSSSDNEVNRHGTLAIKSIKLYMDEPVSPGPDYPDNGGAPFTDQGKVIITYDKKVGKGSSERTMALPISLQMQNVSGQTEIIGCGSADSPATKEDACNMAGKFYNESADPPCQISKGAPKIFPQHGGNSATASVLRCPNNMGIVGIQGNSGSRVDALVIICKEINYQTLKPVTGAFYYYSNRAGGFGGSSFDEKCPSGSFAAGLAGTSGSRIDSIKLLCRDFATNASVSSTTEKGGSGPNNFSDSCNNDTILREIMVRSGSEIDAVRGACW